MTRAEILAMQPGEALDRLVAIHVFGEPEPPLASAEDAIMAELSFSTRTYSEKGCWLLGTTGYDNGDESKWWPCAFSTEIYYAWKVVEKMRMELFHKRNLFCEALAKQFTSEDGKYLIGWPHAMLHMKPEHICKAALLAMVPLG